MPQQEGYTKWSTQSQIPLVLSISTDSGQGLVGATPEVAISRYRQTYGGTLDGWFWDGAGFQATPTWFVMPPVDAVNLPGLYSYVFEQDLVGLEYIYAVYFRHDDPPIGFATEFHAISNEVYIPAAQPDPIIIGSDSVMGQLELVKGLLHHNTMLDRQQYSGGQLTSARLRMFSLPAQVPATPGGSETTGLIAEFSIEATYSGGLNDKYVLKRVYP